jgi:hypothetical protein
MSDQFYSKSYRGFLCQQTSQGWIIPLLPERTQGGLISPGPYSTFQIACHVIDRIQSDPVY